MLKRIVSGLIGLPLLVVVVLYGGWLLQFAILALSLIGLKEFFGALLPKRPPVRFAAYGFAAVYIGRIVDYQPNSVALLLFFSIFIMLMLVFLVLCHGAITIRDVVVTFLGFFYVPFLLSFLYAVWDSPYGAAMVWLVFLSAWGSDTFAYFVGKTIGRHKLCPQLSPNKTVEGAVGGVVGAAVLGMLYAFLMLWLQPGNLAQLGVGFVPVSAAVCAVCAALSQFGDLAASAIKRHTGVKDFGTLIPGHGGVLDRFDSVLFTAPGVYIALALLQING